MIRHDGIRIFIDAQWEFFAITLSGSWSRRLISDCRISTLRTTAMNSSSACRKSTSLSTAAIPGTLNRRASVNKLASSLRVVLPDSATRTVTSARRAANSASAEERRGNASMKRRSTFCLSLSQILHDEASAPQFCQPRIAKLRQSHVTPCLWHFFIAQRKILQSGRCFENHGPIP